MRKLLPLAALALGLAACQDAAVKQPAPPAPRAVLIQTVRFEPLHPERALVGVVRARIESDLGFRIGGKVARRLVEVGAEVAPGQILATLDDGDLKLQREQAWAEVEAAKSAQRQAEAEEKRVSDLRNRGWSTESTFDRQRAAADEALGRVRRALRALELAENALSYAALRADAAGVVTAALIEPGQVVAAGQTAIRLARLDEREAAVSIPETVLELARRGQARATLWSRPDHAYEARLRELAPAADPATRTFAARFSTPGAGDEMRLGMTVTVTLVDPDARRVARLPLAAILDQGQGPSVWVVDPASGSLTLRPVSILRQETQSVLIESGVSDGEAVVALGAQKLDAGQKVRPITSLGS